MAIGRILIQMVPSGKHRLACKWHLAVYAITGAVVLSAAGAVALAVEDVAIEIDRIEVSGVTVFQRSEIETVIEIVPGDNLERAKVVRSAEGLQALYRIHGFEEVSIRSELIRRKSAKGIDEALVLFHVAEGKPTRIASMKFVPENILDQAFLKYWAKVEPELAKRMKVSVGDTMDQEKISAGKRGLQDLLASEEFVGARMNDVMITSATPPPKVASLAAARWVALEFRVDLGDRVTFGFRGNNFFTSSRFSSLVDELRAVGLGKDYEEAVRLRIEDEYKASGYANVKVAAYAIEKPLRHERHITYVIEEGARSRIGKLEFDGNLAFQDHELWQKFIDKASSLLKHGYYFEKDVVKAAELTVEWMKSRGYLSARLITVQPVAINNAFDVVVYVYEGDQTLVRNIKIIGVTVLAEQEIEDMLGVRENQALNLFAFGDGVDAVKAEYRARGYLDVEVTNEQTGRVVQYAYENRLADIELELSEGPQFRVSRVQIEGLGVTAENVVLRELLFREGDVLEEPKIIASENRLKKLGIFSTVSVRVSDDPGKAGYKIVRVAVREGVPGTVAWGVGFRNDLGGRGFGQVGYANLWGRNHTVSFNGNVNRRLVNYKFVEGEGQLSYIWPWFVSDVTFRPTFTVSQTRYLSFSATTVSAAAGWEKKILSKPELIAILSYSLERIRQFSAAAPEDNQTIRIGSLVPGLRFDTRDNPLSPTSGLFAAISYEMASPLFFSQTEPYRVGYTRFQLRSDYFVPFTSEITWYLSFRTGLARNTEPNKIIDPVTGNETGGIPLIKQFSLGGVANLRGYGEQELNFQQKNIFGTLSYVNYRTQIDLPLSGALRFGPFLDAANLLVDEFSFGKLNFGAGVGFRYVTPVGPVNLDWGFRVNPPPGADRSKIYFSIGVI